LIIYLDDGINIDNWTFEGLVEVVKEFTDYKAKLVSDYYNDVSVEISVAKNDVTFIEE
jgi:hypothetical protein